MNTTNTRELSIQDYLDILRRRWKIIIAILLIAAAASGAATVLQETTYQARAEVLIRTGSTDQLFPSATNTGNRLVRQSQAELTYLSTDSYRAAAADALGRSANVSIALVSDANVADTGRISFTNVDQDPQRAFDAAQTYAQAYIDSRNAADVADIQRQLGEAVLEQTNLSEELEALRGPIDDIDARIARTTDPVDLASLTSQRNILLSQLGADVGRLESGVSQASSSVDQLTDASIVITDPSMTAVISNAARVPTSPISTGWVQNLLIALAVGAVLGVGAALLRETIDSRVHSDDEIEALLGVPVIGHIEKMSKRDSAVGLVVNQPKPNQGALESYRKIRSSIMFLQAVREINVIQVTSPVQGNGKTTVAGNLAVAFAQQGQSTLLIDADMRRPEVHRRFLVTGLDDGLSSVLAEGMPFSGSVRLDAVTGVSLIPAGKKPPNPSELLGSEGFQQVCKSARSDFGIALIDTPPLLPVTDGRLVAALVDTVILVIDPSSNSKREMIDSVEFLKQSGAHIAGVVLNRVGGSAGYGHAYGNSHGDD